MVAIGGQERRLVGRSGQHGAEELPDGRPAGRGGRLQRLAHRQLLELRQDGRLRGAQCRRDQIVVERLDERVAALLLAHQSERREIRGQSLTREAIERGGGDSQVARGGFLLEDRRGRQERELLAIDAGLVGEEIEIVVLEIRQLVDEPRLRIPSDGHVDQERPQFRGQPFVFRNHPRRGLSDDEVDGRIRRGVEEDGRNGDRGTRRVQDVDHQIRAGFLGATELGRGILNRVAAVATGQYLGGSGRGVETLRAAQVLVERLYRCAGDRPAVWPGDPPVDDGRHGRWNGDRRWRNRNRGNRYGCNRRRCNRRGGNGRRCNRRRCNGRWRNRCRCHGYWRNSVR